MDTEIVARLREQGNRGIAAVNASQADQASLHFTEALTIAQELGDPRTRRDEVSTLASLFEMAGFPDLALMAAEQAVELSGELGEANQQAQDINSLGTAHLRLGNRAQAMTEYRRALKVFLDQNDYANAASANTNIAGIVAEDGDIPGAISMARKSLEYLEKESFPNTEMFTRLLLLQALELENGDLDLAVENARRLSALQDEMTAEHRSVSAHFIGRLADRYAAAHPGANAQAWSRAQFPALSG